MKNRVLIHGFTLFCLVFFPLALYAAAATHVWPGTGASGNNSMEIDDQGGSNNNGGGNASYLFLVDDRGVTATLSLNLFNGQAVDDGDDTTDLGDNGNTNTGEDFINGTGLQILEPPSILNPPITEIGALSDNPLTPIGFLGSETGLNVEMLSYVQSGTDYIIFEYLIRNNTAKAVPVKIGLMGDFDVNGSPNVNGRDLGVPVVYEYNPAIDGLSGMYYAAGLALAGGNFDNYRLGACCDLTFEKSGNNGHPSIRDAQRLTYFKARPNEECDDGNNTNGDGCSANCLLETGSEVCGNGQVEAGEGCDDGNTNNGDGCSSTCLSELCGDGNLDPGEECDDGGLLEMDGCSSFCTVNFLGANTPEYCGNNAVDNGGVGDQVPPGIPDDTEVALSANLGILNPGESGVAAFCVVGGISDVDGPNAGAQLVLNAMDCQDLYQQTIAVCGNGMQNAGEECDDGNLNDDDGCDSNCTVSGCGNGIVNANEGCDDGNTLDGDGCSSACTLESLCGNGNLDAGEGCDDGNTVNGDGCSAACVSESGSGGGCALDSRLVAIPSLGIALLGILMGLGAWTLRRRTHR